jgi:hypothetical protein
MTRERIGVRMDDDSLGRVRTIRDARHSPAAPYTLSDALRTLVDEALHGRAGDCDVHHRHRAPIPAAGLCGHCGRDGT